MIINRTLFFTLLITLFGLSNIAKAECDGFYIAGRVGYAKYEIEDERSGVSNNVNDYIVDKKRFLASGALGYRYEHFRAAVEYTWRKKNSGLVSGVTDVKFNSQSYMFVVYYDFFPYSWFTPYVDAGLGWSRNKLSLQNNLNGTGNKINETSFTWSLGAGISAKITNRWNLDLGYRYYDMGSIRAAEIDAQEIYAGVRYVF